MSRANPKLESSPSTQFGDPETLNAFRMAQLSLFAGLSRVATMPPTPIHRPERHATARGATMQSTTGLAFGRSAPTFAASACFCSTGRFHGVGQLFSLSFARARLFLSTRLVPLRAQLSTPVGGMGCGLAARCGVDPAKHRRDLPPGRARVHAPCRCRCSRGTAIRGVNSGSTIKQ